MKMALEMEEEFAPARVVAQHCDELTVRVAGEQEKRAYQNEWRAALAREFANVLTGLFPGGKLTLDVAAPQEMLGRDVFGVLEGNTVNCLLRCETAGANMLLSLSAQTALALTDRSYGGDGAASEAASNTLPYSATLLIDTFGQLLAACAGRLAGHHGAKGEVMMRSENAARLKPFEPQVPCALFALNIAEEGGANWQVRLAVSQGDLARLTGGARSTSSSARSEDGAGVHANGERVMSAIPMSMRAIIAEFDLSLDRLRTLAPGDHIPISVPGKVPLLLGHKHVAHGTIGTAGDKLALRLVQLSQEGLTS